MASRIPLDTVCELKIETLSSQYDGKIEYIDISSIDNGEKTISNTQIINSKEAPSRARQLVKNGDILVSTVRPNLNAVAVVKKESDYVLVASTGYCVLRCNSAVDNHYVFHFCQSPYFIDDMVRQATGASYPAVSNLIVRSCLVPLRSLEEQQHIATVLDKLADLISLRKQQLAKLDELVKARFVEMFGDLKHNNMGWPICKFNDFAAIDTTMIHDFTEYGDYPHIGIDSIEKDTGNLSGYRTAKEDGVISGKYLFTPAHIIYSKIRPNLNKVALPDFIGVCSADAYPILPKKGRCNRVFLAYMLRNPVFLDYILALSNRTNLPKVNKQQVEGFCCPIPNIELQEKFASFFSDVARQKLTIQQSLDKLEVLRKSLMQEYFG